MRLEIIVFPIVVLLSFTINIWFGIYILLFNLLAFNIYYKFKYIKWHNYFKIHIVLLNVYLFGKLIGLLISKLMI